VGGGDDWEPEVASFAVESRGAALMLDPLASSPAARGPAPSTTGAGSARRRCTCGAPDPSAADAPTDGRTSSGAFAVVARRVTGSPTRPRHAIVRRTSTDPQRSPAAQGMSPATSLEGFICTPPHSYTIRVATDEDAEALRRLAALDSKAPLEATVLVGEIAGTPAAAISLGDDRAIADLTSTFSSSRKGAAKWPAPRAACPPTASVASALPETAFAKSSAPADPGRVCSREHARSRKPPGRSGSSGWSRLAAARGAARPTASGHADEQRRARQMMDFQSHIMRLTRPLI
jgi:hypothetical protein